MKKLIKQKLIERGFSKETLLNNRGLIGAIIDETKQAITVVPCCMGLPTNSEMNIEINKEFATWDKEKCANIQSFGCGFKTGVIWNHNKNKKI